MAMSPGAREIFELSRASAAADTTAPNPPPSTVPNQESAPTQPQGAPLPSVSASSTSTPTTDRQTQGSIQLGVADRLAARLPPSLQGFVRGAAERTIEPAMDVVRGVQQGQPLTAAGGAAQLSQFATPAGQVIAIGGTALQGIAEAAGMNQNSARVLAAGAEAGASFAPFAKAKFDMRAGRKMLGEASELGGASGNLLKKERVMESVRGEARTNLLARKAHWKKALDRTEVEIASRGKITPNTPTWHKLQETVNDFGEDVMGPRVKDTPAGRVITPIGRITDSLAVGADVDPYDVVMLRREMGKKADFASDLKSPDAATTSQMISAARTKLADVLEGAAPSPQAAANYAAARSGYANEYARPWRNLDDVLNPNTSPVEAFGKVFNTSDLHTFRAMAGAVKANPSMAGKLRMGLIEGLGEASNGFQDANAALGKFRQFRPALETTGLYTQAELNSLDAVLRQKRIPTLIDGLRFAVSTPGRAGVAAGATGGSLALAHFLAVNPAAALGSVVAAGALPHLIRASIVPAGSPAMRTVASVIGSKVSHLARTLKMGEGPASPVEAGDSEE